MAASSSLSEGSLRRITPTLESCVKQPPNESTEGWRAAGSERSRFMQHFSHSETRHKKLSDTNCDIEGKLVIGRVRHKGDVSTDVLASCFWDHWDVISVKVNQELKPRQWFTLMVLNGIYCVRHPAASQFQQRGQLLFNGSFIWHHLPWGPTQLLRCLKHRIQC